jgi:hypothetical protein
VQAARTAEKQKPFFIGAAALFLAGLTAWGVLALMAKGNAQKELTQKEAEKAKLESIAGPIQTQFKEQDKLVALASQYTKTEEERTFWLGALQELQAAFASDVVWITDLEPIYGHSPLAPKTENKPKSVVKAEFYSQNYGVTGMENIKVDAPAATSRNRQAAAVTEVTPGANAVRIKGFWRSSDNPKAGNVVYDLIKRLRGNSPQGSHFKFTALPHVPTGARPPANANTPTEVPDEQLVQKLDSAPAESDFAGSFELIIPLSREVNIR